MESRIQYTTTRDGFEVAYRTIGEGIPLVVPPPASPWSHIEQEWQIPEWRHWYEHLSDFCQVIRYDNRGSGSSERDIPELSLETELTDIQAVVDALKLERFAIFGLYFASLVSIAYAARNPERVSHLVLWSGFERGKDPENQDTNAALQAIMDVDYPLFTETLAHQVFGWGEGEPAHRFAQMMQAATVPATVRMCWASHEVIDLSGEIGKVSPPTLLLHRRQLPQLSAQQQRELASRMPDARLVLLDGSSLAPYIGDMETPLNEVARFLGADHDQPPIHHRSAQSAGFKTILFTDIEGSTATTQLVGDDRAHEMLRMHNDIVRRALHSYDGTEVKHTGDGIMASFTSAVAGIECAIAIQRRIAAQTMMQAEWPPFAVRIGINAGEPVMEGGDLFGTSVQIASRICTAAEPRQILVSDVVRQLVAGKGFLFSGQGETELRGLEEPVRLFEVRWHETA